MMSLDESLPSLKIDLRNIMESVDLPVTLMVYRDGGHIVTFTEDNTYLPLRGLKWGRLVREKIFLNYEH